MEEKHEIVTEGDAREFVESADGKVLHLPIIPMTKEIWFVQAGDHFTVVTLMDGSLGMSEPSGDDITIHNDGEVIEMFVLDEDELPFSLDTVEEAAEEHL